MCFWGAVWFSSLVYVALHARDEHGAQPRFKLSRNLKKAREQRRDRGRGSRLVARRHRHFGHPEGALHFLPARGPGLWPRSTCPWSWVHSCWRTGFASSRPTRLISRWTSAHSSGSGWPSVSQPPSSSPTTACITASIPSRGRRASTGGFGAVDRSRHDPGLVLPLRGPVLASLVLDGLAPRRFDARDLAQVAKGCRPPSASPSLRNGCDRCWRQRAWPGVSLRALRLLRGARVRR
jgi:hypothetical protein